MTHKTQKKLLELNSERIIAIVVIGLIVLFFALIVNAEIIFQDNFESYSVDDLVGQGDWWCYNEGDCFDILKVSATEVFEGSLAVKSNMEQNNSWPIVYKGGNALATGTIAWWFMFDNVDTTPPWPDTRDELYFSIADASSSETIKIRAGNFSTTTDNKGKIDYYDPELADYVELGELASSTWYSISIEFDCIYDRAKFNFDFKGWTDWVDNYICDSLSFWIIKIHDGTAEGNPFDFYLDYITREAGVIGECGSGSYCYFCLTEEDCEEHNCQWIVIPYGHLCVETLPPLEEETTTQFANYYAENSDFSTPTEFISGLASSTSPFLMAISSWVSNFSGYFDLEVAQARGEQIGEAIPKARGYLVFFNSVFSDLPLSEILVIYLIVLLGVVIFRVIRQIKKLLIT